MRDGQAGLGHPPWRGGGGVGLATVEACLQGSSLTAAQLPQSSPTTCFSSWQKPSSSVPDGAD